MGSTSAAAGQKAGRGTRLRAASFDDHAQITALEARYGLDARSYDEWSHFWLGNPLYRELQPDWAIGWVVEDDNKQIVASVGNIPLLYEFGGKRILAVSGRSQVAEPAYRSATLLLLDRLINQPGVDLYLNNTMTIEAAPSFTVFECPRVPAGLWDESAFWITGYRGFVESLLAMRNNRLAKPLSYPLSAAAFLKDRVTQKALRESDVELRVYPGFDDRFDEFWEDLKSRNPHLLLAVRTREILEWHFRHALLDHRLWIVTVVDGPRLAAYAIFDRKDNAELGLKRVRLVDFQSRDGSSALLSPTLSWALKRCRDERIHMLENVGGWMEKGEFVDTVAPHRRKLSTWTYFYRANNPGLAESLKDRRAWSPSLFDGNASL